MSTFGWIVLALFVQIAMATLWPDKIGKGRILTRPLWKVPFLRPSVSPYTGRLYAGHVRLIQILLMGAAYALTQIFLGTPNWYSPVLVALYLDDYLTGDDDQWKRFKERARNKIKWRMTLPASAANH